MAKHRGCNDRESSNAVPAELTVQDMQLILSKKFGMHVQGMGLLRPDTAAPPMLGQRVMNSALESGGGVMMAGMKRGRAGSGSSHLMKKGVGPALSKPRNGSGVSGGT